MIVIDSYILMKHVDTSESKNTIHCYRSSRCYHLTLYMLNFQRKHKHAFTFVVIPPHWQAIDSWNPSSYQDLHILHNQYHGCWCPGDARSQGFNSHDIDLVKPIIRSPHVKGSFITESIAALLHMTACAKPRDHLLNSIQLDICKHCVFFCDWFNSFLVD